MTRQIRELTARQAGAGEELSGLDPRTATLLTLYALLVVAGLVVLVLAYTGRVRLPLYAVGALIVALAALIVAGSLWLLLASLNPG